MEDHQITVRQEQRVGHVALAVEVGRLGAKLGRVLVTAHGHDHVNGFHQERVENSAVDVDALVGNGTESRVDRPARGQVGTQSGSPSSPE